MYDQDNPRAHDQTDSRDPGKVRSHPLERMGVLSERLSANILAPHRLTLPQSRVLEAMQQHGGDLPLQEIASVTSFPLGALTSIMDRLLLRGLVEQRTQPGGSQGIALSITAAGTEVVAAVNEARARLRTRLLDGFSSDELAVIERLAARLAHEVAASATDLHEHVESAPPRSLRLIK